MITPELITYIRQQLAAGVPREIVARALAQSGWSPQDTAQAFAAAAISATTSPINQKTKTPSFTGRGVLLSLGLVMASALYAFFQYGANPQQPPAVVASLSTSENPPASPAPVTASHDVTQPAQPQPENTTTVVQTPTASAPPPQKPAPVAVQNTTPIQTKPVPTPTPAPKPAGQYADGTYTGSAANAYYGTVQVQATVQNGALAGVQFLQYPSDRNTSRYINGQAMPILKSEAIQAQSSNVDIVSGATFTSQAFQQSLSSALAQAKN